MTTKTNRRPHPIVAVARATWRQLRTMRTALILLLLLGAGASLGSRFPQRAINPATVSQWIARNRGWAPIAEKLGLFDVFGSWWFMAIYGLLLVSLVGCILPRWRAFVRTLRARPGREGTLSLRRRNGGGLFGLTPDRAFTGAERVLRGKRFGFVRADGRVAAGKGHRREGGSCWFTT